MKTRYLSLVTFIARLDRAIGINTLASTDGPAEPGRDDKAPFNRIESHYTSAFNVGPTPGQTGRARPNQPGTRSSHHGSETWFLRCLSRLQ
jgi:hypothetical protein